MDSCGFVPVDNLVRTMDTAPTPDQVVHIAQTDDKASPAVWPFAAGSV